MLREVAAEHKIPVETILGPSRRKTACAARHDAMWRIRSLRWRGQGYHGHPSYPQIGRWFGRDHTSVMAAVAKVSEACFLRPEDVLA